MGFYKGTDKKMKENELEQKQMVINWAPYSMMDLASEKGEAERVIQTVLGVDSSDPKYFGILKSMGSKILYGKLTTLTDEMWSKLENTDSWKNVQSGDLKKAEEISRFYKKNFPGILEGIKNGSKIPVPIIFKVGDKTHLMSGNNRLMIARGLKQRPMVIIVEYP